MKRPSWEEWKVRKLGEKPACTADPSRRCIPLRGELTCRHCHEIETAINEIPNEKGLSVTGKGKEPAVDLGDAGDSGPAELRSAQARKQPPAYRSDAAIESSPGELAAGAIKEVR